MKLLIKDISELIYQPIIIINSNFITNNNNKTISNNSTINNSNKHGKGVAVIL